MSIAMQSIPSTCVHTGCCNPATHYPMMRIPAKKFMKAAFPEPLSLVIGLKLCLEHVVLFDSKYTITQNPKHFSAAFNALSKDGEFPVDVDAVYVEPLPLDSELAQKYEAMAFKKQLTANKGAVH